MTKGAILFSPGPFGGAEKLILDSTKELNLEILLIKEMRNPAPCDFFIKELNNKGINYTEFASKSRYDKTLVKQLNTYINKMQIDFIHSHGLKANFINSFLMTKKLATQHGQTSHTLKMKVMEYIESIRLKKMDNLILVSEVMYEKTKHPRKILLENYVPENEKKLAQFQVNDKFKIAFAGRLSPEKGIEFLLESIELNQNTELHIYGDGLLSDYVKNRISSQIIYHGFTSSIQEELLDKQLLIIPSEREGLPMIALESLSLGLPVLATRVGGLPKLIADDTFLFDFGDIEGLNKKINFISQNYGKILNQTQMISQKVQEKYSKSHWIEKIKTIYDKVVNNL